VKSLRRYFGSLLPALLFSVGGLTAQGSSDRDRVSAVLDALHAKASEADFDGYFDLYADEAVFLGTDATERWPRDAFMAYTKPRFDTGTGWTYTLIERHVTIAPGGQTAWFDERLDNASIGESRGSGVLVRQDGEWKIAQYNLTVPIPNDLLRGVAEEIRAFLTPGSH